MSAGISFLQRSAPDSFSLASHPLIPNSVNRFDISIAISLNLAPYPADGGSQGVFVHIVFIRTPPDLVALLVISRQENHQRVRILRLYEPAQVIAAAVRQVDIQKYQVIFRLCQ